MTTYDIRMDDRVEWLRDGLAKIPGLSRREVAAMVRRYRAFDASMAKAVRGLTAREKAASKPPRVSGLVGLALAGWAS
jgi:hypothetical protein